MPYNDLSNGMMFTGTYTVKEEWTATAMESGETDVLSTTALILTIEKLAFSSLMPHIEKGYTTVGTKVHLTHLYPINKGETFRIELLLSKISDSKIEFSITAKHQSKVIALGIHKRRIVNTSDFLSRTSL
ncbi:MAG: hypothetical protein PF689_07885 [Deltaproteobacteria bacterium]|jgi:fluoroacetyl-CoA thioesterase|nr:hypothetical protein [Deltaproteobacteria bacterium]